MQQGESNSIIYYFTQGHFSDTLFQKASKLALINLYVFICAKYLILIDLAPAYESVQQSSQRRGQNQLT